MMTFLMGLVSVVQFALHYLGWIGMLLGVIALAFGNIGRGLELLIGGLGFLAMKYLLGVGVFGIVGFVHLLTKHRLRR